METQYTFTERLNRWMLLIKTIRAGVLPEQYELLLEFPNTTDALCSLCDEEVQYSYQLRAFHVLLETSSDPLIPPHWRSYCADQLYRPMFALQRLSTTPALKRLTKLTLAKTLGVEQEF